MTGYRLGLDAEEDLAELTRYSLDRWGVERTARYLSDLEDAMRGIAAGTIPSRAPFPSHPSVHWVRRGQHVLLAIVEPPGQAHIVAVLHARMDLVRRVAERLERLSGEGP